MNDVRRDVAHTACSDVGAHARYHTRRQSALPPPPLPPLRALRPSARQRERGGERAPPRSRAGERRSKS